MIQEMTPTQGVAPGASASIWGRSYRPLTVGLILSVSGPAFEALAVATTMPATSRDLGGLWLYGWAFSAFMLANLLGISVAGAEADRQGPLRPYFMGVSLFVLGLLVVGLAPAMEVVILGRAIQGFGAGVLSSVAYVVIGRGYPEALKARMLAVLSSAWVIPGLIGPALAGLITDAVGWRWVFLGLTPFILLAGALTAGGLRQLGGGSRAPRDWRGLLDSLRLAAGAGLLLSGLGQLATVLGAGMVAVGLLVGLPALRRLLPAGTLRAAPGLPAAIAAHCLLNLAFFGVDAFVPLALTSGRGQSASVAGLALTAATITWTSGAWVQAHLAARVSRRLLVIGGLLLIVLGIAGVAATLAPSVPVLLAAISWAVAGFGIGLAFSTHSLVVLESAPAGQEGSSAAALQLSNVLGFALGAGIGGVIVGGTSASGSVSLSGLLYQDLLMIGVALLAMLVARRLPERAAAGGSPASI